MYNCRNIIIDTSIKIINDHDHCPWQTLCKSPEFLLHNNIFDLAGLNIWKKNNAIWLCNELCLPLREMEKRNHSSAALAALRSTLKSRTCSKEKYDPYEETYIFTYGWDILYKYDTLPPHPLFQHKACVCVLKCVCMCAYVCIIIYLSSDSCIHCQNIFHSCLKMGGGIIALVHNKVKCHQL